MIRQLCMLIVMSFACSYVTGQAAFPQTVTNVKFGGRLMNDWTFMSGDNELKSTLNDNLVDGVEIRRARIFTTGTLQENINYKLQFDFAGGDPEIKDAYVEFTGLPAGIKIGHFKEPFSLEAMTSSKFYSFLELSLPGCFAPIRNNGIQVSTDRLDKRLTFAAGVFGDVGDYGNADTEGGYNMTARVTGLPYRAEDGSKILHLGLSFSSRNFNGTTQYSQCPEVHRGPKYVDTDDFAAEGAHILNAEGAVVLGRFSMQAEMTSASVKSKFADDPSFLGYYAMASYFITGDNRKYQPGATGYKPNFGRIHPQKKFVDGGTGAVEVVIRYSGLDLTDKGIVGGELSDVTLGVNWYLNSHTRVMVNYIRAELHDVGTSHILATRFQIDF